MSSFLGTSEFVFSCAYLPVVDNHILSLFVLSACLISL